MFTHTFTNTHTYIHSHPCPYSDLPPLGAVMIKIYRENYSKKRREKAPPTDIGKIEMPALILESGQLMEKWYIKIINRNKNSSYM